MTVQARAVVTLHATPGLATSIYLATSTTLATMPDNPVVSPAPVTPARTAARGNPDP